MHQSCDLWFFTPVYVPAFKLIDIRTGRSVKNMYITKINGPCRQLTSLHWLFMGIFSLPLMQALLSFDLAVMTSQWNESWLKWLTSQHWLMTRKMWFILELKQNHLGKKLKMKKKKNSTVASSILEGVADHKTICFLPFFVQSERPFLRTLLQDPLDLTLSWSAFFDGRLVFSKCVSYGCIVRHMKCYVFIAPWTLTFNCQSYLEHPCLNLPFFWYPTINHIFQNFNFSPLSSSHHIADNPLCLWLDVSRGPLHIHMQSGILCPSLGVWRHRLTGRQVSGDVYCIVMDKGYICADQWESGCVSCLAYFIQGMSAAGQKSYWSTLSNWHYMYQQTVLISHSSRFIYFF